MIALLLAEKIFSLFLMMFTGYILVKFKLSKPEDSKILSVACIYIISPCMIIAAFQKEFNEEVRNGLFLAFGGAILAHIILIVVTEILSFVLHFDAIEKVSLIYSNSANLIIPIVTSIMGDDWVIYSSAYIFIQLILLWTHGISVICGKHNFDIKKIILNINMIAIVIGLVLFFLNFRLPGPLGDANNSIAVMVGPISMIITGMLIGGMDLKKAFAKKRVWFIVIFRLILLPVIVLLILKYLPLYKLSKDGRNIFLITNIATMAPSASVITQLAQIYEKDADYASSINVLSILLCIITMPILVYIYLF